MSTRILGALAFLISVFATSAFAQAGKPGDTYRSPGGATLKLFLDDSNVGPEVSIGELTFWVPGEEAKKIAARWTKEP